MDSAPGMWRLPLSPRNSRSSLISCCRSGWSSATCGTRRTVRIADSGTTCCSTTPRLPFGCPFWCCWSRRCTFRRSWARGFCSPWPSWRGSSSLLGWSTARRSFPSSAPVCPTCSQWRSSDEHRNSRGAVGGPPFRHRPAVAAHRPGARPLPEQPAPVAGARHLCWLYAHRRRHRVLRVRQSVERTAARAAVREHAVDRAFPVHLCAAVTHLPNLAPAVGGGLGARPVAQRRRLPALGGG